ncbi:hypothetical protein D3C81_1518680 [compost metagenome]
MHQHDVRLHAFIGFVEVRQQLFREPVEGLALGHDLQVFIDRQFERVEHLLEHFPMLAGGADVQVDAGPVTQNPRQGCHLDGFRSCAENHHDFKGHEPSRDCTRRRDAAIETGYHLCIE